MKVAVTARDVGVGAGCERGSVTVHLEVDRKHGERLVADAFRALPDDARARALADLISSSQGMAETAREVLADLDRAAANRERAAVAKS